MNFLLSVNYNFEIKNVIIVPLILRTSKEYFKIKILKLAKPDTSLAVENMVHGPTAD